MAEKIILAYSGGLDTSVACKWLQEERGYDVHCLTIDLGNLNDLESAKKRGTEAGALSVNVIDAKEDFLNYFVFPAMQANALYQGQYPLATALGRPLIAKLLVDKARELNATSVAHGCTGKGNDQVRLDVAINTLAPDLNIVGTARENEMSRDAAIDYAKKHGISIKQTLESPYSTDENLWGRSVECGELEDPWEEPPSDVWLWTAEPEAAPDKPAILEIGFENGIPVSLDGEKMGAVELVQNLSNLGGQHGIGRVDMVEDRLVGIKSREVYEAPAATILITAHKSLEQLTLSRSQIRMKEQIAQEYADLIYNGLWYSGHHRDLAAYIQSSQRDVTGQVRVKLWKGVLTILGKQAERSLYSKELATYGDDDQFDQKAAQGFIKLHGLSVQVQAHRQLLNNNDDPLYLASPEKTE
ncbi:MAG: argininosuccinate synthase [Dehalococcoidia bacterium]|jgi:argininosuccinate synthase|nr:argininosuccinate synthase [Dehalococcoidia bacterium]|tara:strand:+ start:40821 stop:42062 length:1242 start_codon:yes stop_codon:yes gene_type:complete